MTFSWYGFLIGLSFILFSISFEKIVKQSRQIPEEKTSQAILFLALGAVIGARLYHLITDWQLYRDTPWWTIFALRNGGLGIFGAIVGGYLGLYFWKKWKKPQLTWYEILDAAAISLPAAQALGRWGNFINQELFGKPTTLPWGIYIDPQHRPTLWQSQATFHPLFLYESLFSLSLAVFLWLMYKKFPKAMPLGSRFFLSYYLIGYGSIRMSLEILRYPTPLFLGLTSGQWSSLLMIIVGLLAFPRVFSLQWKQNAH